MRLDAPPPTDSNPYPALILWESHGGKNQKFTVAAKDGTDRLYSCSSAEYDENGIHTKNITTMDGTVAAYEYAADDRVTRVIGQKSYTKNIYSKTGNKLDYSVSEKRVSDNTEMSAVDYNHTGQYLTSISTPGMEYSFEYDAFGNRTNTKVGNQTLMTNTYMPDNRSPEKNTYGNGDTITYQYDKYNRNNQIVKRTALTGRLATAMWEYDGYGNISRFTDTTPGSTVRTNYVYDSIGRISSFLRNDGFGGEIGYDSFNRVTGAWYKNIDGSRGTSYTYDSKTGLVSSLETDGLRVNNTYDGLNRISQKSYGFKNVTAENYVEKFTYRREGNRTDSQVTSHTFGSVTTRYEYDSAGNITAVRDNSGNLLNSYEYDELDRLTAEKDARTGKWYEYRYNSAGDMDLVTVYNCTVDAVSKEFVKGAEEYKNRFYFTNGNWENQCTTVILNGSTSNLTYDAIGNPLSYRDGMTMTWQNGRQLKSIVKGDTTLEFTYDINGQRQSKVEKKNGTTVHTTKYYYDGTKLAAENKDGTIVWYDYDENGVPIGMRVNGQDYIFRRNLQGDIVKIFNSDNDTVVGYNYQNAWGGGVEVTGPLGGSIGKYNSLRYRGYYYDSEFGLYYLNSRYYDPAMCRFINADGYVSTGQGNAGLNMYAYCAHNPIYFTDVDGEDPVPYWARNIVYGEPASNDYLLALNCNPDAWTGSAGFIVRKAVGIAEDYNNIYSVGRTKGPRKDPRKGAETRKKTGLRERNVAHPNGEEHSRVPKGNKRGIQRDLLPDILAKAGVLTVSAVVIIVLCADDTTVIGIADNAVIPIFVKLAWDTVVSI